jgi:ABC-type multidrug transport system ATPase subunit
VTSSTPDALWSAPSLRVLRPAAVICSDLRRGRDLDRCSLSVPAGARLLVVSEPESSASTLLRVLAGLSRPTRGRIKIAGSSDPSPAGFGLRMAYVGPQTGLQPWMTPREALRLAADLLDLPREEAARRVERAAAWTGIPASALSRPMRRGGPPLEQRTAFAAALIGDPEVLLLDEPLRGLDASERSRLLRLPGRRRTILLASRYPASEAGHVAHVVFLRAGRVELIVPVEELAAAGLPMSHRGIEQLAERRASATGPVPASSVRPA